MKSCRRKIDFKKMVTQSPDLMGCLDRDGCLQYVNDACQDMLGYTGRELLGRPLRDLLHPDDQNTWPSLPSIMHGKEKGRLENRCMHKKGHAIFISWSFGWSAPDGLLYCTGRQLAAPQKDELPGQERQTSKRALSGKRPDPLFLENRQADMLRSGQLNTIFESITDGFFTLDRNWHLTYMNTKAARMLEVDREGLVGKNVWEQFPGPVSEGLHQQYRKAFSTGQSMQFETYSTRLDKWFGVKLFPSPEGLSTYFEDVTERVKTRMELERLSLVASNTTNSVVITNKARRIEWVNEGFTRITGYSLEEAAGESPHELLYNPKAPVNTYELVKHRVLAGERVVFEMLTRKKNGDDMWSYVQIIPLRDEAGELSSYITIHADITDKVKTRLELEKLSLVASRTNNSVLIADKNYRIEWVNTGFTRLLGYRLEEALGSSPPELLHTGKTNAEGFTLSPEQLLRGQPVSFETRYAKKNGEEVWLSVENSPIFDGSGNLSGFIEIQTDITALKESELALAQSAKDLYQQNKDLQQFAYIVSHNLRAPVANVLGLTDLLTRSQQDAAWQESCLENLKQSALDLDTVIRDMNTILSIRESKANLEQEPVAVALVVKQALSFLQEPFRNCAGRIHLDLAKDFSVKANKAYLYSIFCNLLSNAIKYRSPERPLEVQIKGLGHTEKGALISFSDNGSGFDMKKASNKIFKLYKRFHPGSQGRGIGLYLVKTHLEAMGGSIEVKSQLDGGTSFLIYLPKDN